MDQVVGVSHECDIRPEANDRRASHIVCCTMPAEQSRSGRMGAPLALHEDGTILHDRRTVCASCAPRCHPHQNWCDVCAVGYGTVARLAETLPGPPRVINLEPSSLFRYFRRHSDVLRKSAVFPSVQDELIGNCHIASKQCVASRLALQIGRGVFLMEWVDPPFVPVIGTGAHRDRRWMRPVRT